MCVAFELAAASILVLRVVRFRFITVGRVRQVAFCLEHQSRSITTRLSSAAIGRLYRKVLAILRVLWLAKFPKIVLVSIPLL